ncbi:MAG: hypothetical protein KDJ97_33255 [Anaerolineae bacterium]|nr:hypothetical protein [Anaerolineae bacterium]
MPISYQDFNSPNHIRFPNPYKRSDVIKLAQSFITYEQTLPIEQQTPFTPLISELLDRVLTYEDELKQAERQRQSAATALERLVAETKEIIWNMWKSVTAKCSGKPVQATRWGFEYKAQTGNVLLPKTFAERLETLNSYIAQEQSRTEADRITIPDLIKVMNLRDTLAAHSEARVAGRRQRESRVELCNELAMELSNYLQVAGVYILAMEFKFKLSKDLQKWGYVISAKRSQNGRQGEASTTPIPTPGSASDGGGQIDAPAEVEVDANTGEA